MKTRCLEILLLIVCIQHGNGREIADMQASHQRALKQQFLSPVTDALNMISAVVGDAVTAVTGGVVGPSLYFNASEGTLTANANLDLNAPLSFSCCNLSFSESGGLANRTLYLASQTGSVNPVIYPGWTGDVVRTGNDTFGIAMGMVPNGIQVTNFVVDHVDNQTQNLQRDYIAASLQYSPGNLPFGIEYKNQAWNQSFQYGNVSQAFTGTGTPVPNGVRKLLALLF